MVTPADADWILEDRKREIYQLTEARWAMEGVFVPRSHGSIIQPSRWLRRLKTFLWRQAPDRLQAPSGQEQPDRKYLEPSPK
jgi:hypothetical protein